MAILKNDWANFLNDEFKKEYYLTWIIHRKYLFASQDKYIKHLSEIKNSSKK